MTRAAPEPDDPLLQLDVALVKAPAPAPVLVAEGPMRTAGRAFEAPPPPDELHVTFTRRPPPLIWLWLIGLPIAAVWLTAALSPTAGMFAVLPFMAILIAVGNDHCRLVASHQRIAFRRTLMPWSSWRTIPVKTIEWLDLAERWPFGIRLVLRAGGRNHVLHRTRNYTEISRLKSVLEDRLRLPPPATTPAPIPALPDAPAKLG